MLAWVRVKSTQARGLRSCGRHAALGHAALLLLDLLRRFGDGFRGFLGFGGGGGDNGKELLNGETLERLGDVLDVRHLLGLRGLLAVAWLLVIGFWLGDTHPSILFQI